MIVVAVVAVIAWVAWNDSNIGWAHNWIGRQRSAPDPDLDLARDLAALEIFGMIVAKGRGFKTDES
jgi:hypothetical protein